jgi:hypothetical protein
MKRSDALEIIDTVLYEHELPLLQGIDKEILGRLERAGMLPPAVDPKVFGLKPEHVWEPEDD